MQAGLPPELDALKNTIRQIVKDECYPLEAEFLVNPSQEGGDEGAPRGIAEALSGLLGTLPKESWDRLNKVPGTRASIRPSFPRNTAAAAWGLWAMSSWTKRCTRASCNCRPRRCP